MLEALDDAELSERTELLYDLARHQREDLRTAVRSLIGRVARDRVEFARTMADLCMGGLRYQAAEGVHTSLLGLLRNELAGRSGPSTRRRS